LTGISSNSVKITESIPNSEYGDDVNENEFDAAFNAEIKSVNSGNVSIALNETPVYVDINQDAY